MKVKPYKKYKDSGIEWLGEVPDHWTIGYLKYIFNIVGGSTPKSGEETFWTGNIVWITPSDLSKRNSIYINDSKRTITEKGLKSCGTSLIPKGSIIISTRAPIGSIAISSVELCTNQGCKALSPFKNISYKYFYYFLSISVNQLNMKGKGTTFLELSGEELGSFPTVFPEINEQNIITSFLDRETSRIDSLIKEKEKENFISLLKEKRQALISHAVTKGLEPTVKMKDSGVEWLGDVPEHWISSRLKYLTRQIVDGAHFTPTYADDGIPFLRVTDLHNKKIDLNKVKFIPVDEHNELIKRCKPEKGDLLLSKNGTIGLTKINMCVICWGF